eukprot:GHVL01010813.1.p1 GENE.GHVL01010813.1~~GHVL01010813.1.p1  ORF type:complete len:164 (+),score=22.97 GHVL01010813.1:32-523(+)
MVRHKRRYSSCEINWIGSQPTIDENELRQSIVDQIATLWGDLTVAKMQSQLKLCMFNADTSLCIIRFAPTYIKEFHSSLTLLTSLKQRQCRIRLLHTAGSLKSCARAMKEHIYRWYCDTLKAVQDEQSDTRDSKIILISPEQRVGEAKQQLDETCQSILNAKD